MTDNITKTIFNVGTISRNDGMNLMYNHLNSIKPGAAIRYKGTNNSDTWNLEVSVEQIKDKQADYKRTCDEVQVILAEYI